MAIVARRYAEALIKTAIESNAVAKFEEQLESLSALLSEGKFKDVLYYPGLSVAKKEELINAALKDKFDKEVINFLLLILNHGRLKFFGEMVSEYKEMADKHKNILHVEIVSAAELEKAQISKIQEKVAKQYNTDNVRVKTVIDPSVIGGVLLKIGDTVIDGTIKARLQGIEKAILQS